MDNLAYHPDPSTEEDNYPKEAEVFTISHGNLSANRNNEISSKSLEHLVPVYSRATLFKKPKVYKTSTIILGVICILLLIGLIILIILYCAGKILNNYCSSDECLRTASDLKYSLDLSVDPCEDFYKFTCGHWSDEHLNHGWFKSFSSFAEVREKVIIASYNFLKSGNQSNDPITVTQSKTLYQSCLDQESKNSVGFTVIFKYLRKVGLPIVPTLFTSKSDEERANFKMDWLKVEANIKRIFNSDVLFGFAVDANSNNVSENVMFIGTPGNQCPLPTPFKKREPTATETDTNELKNEILQNIFKFIVKKFMQETKLQPPSEDLLEHAAFVVNNVSDTINGLSVNFSSSSDNSAFSSFSIPQLQKEIDGFTNDGIQKTMPEFLQNYINFLFENIENVSIDFNEDRLYIPEGEKQYIFYTMSYLLDTSEIYIELYLWWSSVYSMILNTTTEMMDFIANELEVLYATSDTISTPKSVECVELVQEFMPLAVTYGIADKSFTNTSGLRVKNMLNDIREAFKKSVEKLTWMDTQTKQATLEKSRNTYSYIGFPEWLFEKGKLEEYYGNLKFSKKTYLQNLMDLTEKKMIKSLGKLRKENRRDFPVSPIEVNAYNSFFDNSIIVPLAYLTFPMYHLGLEVLNYGSTGSVLGHELIHGFDNKGRKHDKFGNLRQWWSNDTIDVFLQKTQCFIEQYDNITIEGVEGSVDGSRTLGENIADNGGLHHAFMAYKNYKKRSKTEPKLPGFEKYTHDQLFFIAFGSIWCETISASDLEDQLESDNHCPNSVRVNMCVSNSKEFSAAFHCSSRSKMNPKKKCKIW